LLVQHLVRALVVLDLKFLVPFSIHGEGTSALPSIRDRDAYGGRNCADVSQREVDLLRHHGDCRSDELLLGASITATGGAKNPQEKLE
jgi:hypothetical protein